MHILFRILGTLIIPLILSSVVHSQTSYQKPGAPVTFSYSLPENISVGEPFTLNIELNSSTQNGRLELQLNAQPSLAILSENQISFDLSKGTMVTEVNLIGHTNGKPHLNLTVIEFDNDGQQLQSRSFAVPVPVGVQNKPSINKRKTMQHNNMKSNDMKSNDENIIEMIAEDKRSE